MRRREPGHRPLTAAPSKSRLEDLNAAAASFPYYTPAAIEALSGEMSAIVGALPPGIPPQRLVLFRKVFREWWELDVQQCADDPVARDHAAALLGAAGG